MFEFEKIHNQHHVAISCSNSKDMHACNFELLSSQLESTNVRADLGLHVMHDLVMSANLWFQAQARSWMAEGNAVQQPNLHRQSKYYAQE